MKRGVIATLPAAIMTGVVILGGCSLPQTSSDPLAGRTVAEGRGPEYVMRLTAETDPPDESVAFEVDAVGSDGNHGTVYFYGSLTKPGADRNEVLKVHQVTLPYAFVVPAGQMPYTFYIHFKRWTDDGKPYAPSVDFNVRQIKGTILNKISCRITVDETPGRSVRERSHREVKVIGPETFARCVYEMPFPIGVAPPA